MSLKSIMRFAIIVFIAILGLVGCAVWRPIGAIEVNTPRSLSLGEPDAEPVTLEAHAIVTGWVKAPANILIDQDAADLPADLRAAQWVPSIAYVVRHPERGVVILDTGLRAGACDYGMRPVYWVPCRNAPGDDLVSRIQELGIEADEISYIIPSHFHGDHISGLEALLAFTDAPILTTQAALKTVRAPWRSFSGVPSRMLARNMDVVVSDNAWSDDADLGRVLDVFGDGSLKLIETPGHARGHVSAWLRVKAKSLLLTFDAAHLQANMDLQLPSGAVASRADAAGSLAALQSLARTQPDLEVIYGHEPEQWRCGRTVVKLAATSCAG